MKYVIRINKRIKYLKTYKILKKAGPSDNFLTRVFVRLFNKKEPKDEMPL
jgi:hypothetical protein